jgi:hypothetical protein
MYLAVKSVKPLDTYQLLLKFENEEEKILDMRPYLEIGKFSELKDETLFNSVFISFDSIQWANHLDLDPEFLYQKSVTASSLSEKSVSSF